PGLCRNMFLECKQGQMSRAQRLALPFARLTAALSQETSPAPLKYALSVFGLMSPKVRLPMVELTDQSKTELIRVLESLFDSYSGALIGNICALSHRGWPATKATNLPASEAGKSPNIQRH